MANYVPVKLAYEVLEPSGGADETLFPIIFLHGVTGTKETWSNVPQFIADGTKRRTFAVDARNHGDSEYTEAFSFDLNVNDLFHFMDTIHAHKAIIVGHSMGGITAIRAALKKPERIEMIVVEDMFVKKIPQLAFDGVLEFTNMWMVLVHNIPPQLSEPEAIKFTLDYMFSQMPEGTQHFSKTEDLYNLKVPLKRRPDGGYDVKFNKEVILSSLRNGENLMSEPSGQYNGPAYFLYGELSPFQVGSEENNIRKHFPKAELIAFEGATHHVHMEFPKKFTDAVLSLFK